MIVKRNERDDEEVKLDQTNSETKERKRKHKEKIENTEREMFI